MERAGFEMEKVDSREKKRTEKNRRDGDYEWIHGKGRIDIGEMERVESTLDITEKKE